MMNVVSGKACRVSQSIVVKVLSHVCRQIAVVKPSGQESNKMEVWNNLKDYGNALKTATRERDLAEHCEVFRNPNIARTSITQHLQSSLNNL